MGFAKNEPHPRHQLAKNCRTHAWSFRSGSQGRLHRSRHVRSSRKARSRHPGGLRNGRGEDYAEGFGKEYVHQKVMEVRFWKKIKKKTRVRMFFGYNNSFHFFL